MKRCMRANKDALLQLRVYLGGTCNLIQGPALAGVVGVARPRYMFFGEAVSVSTLMEGSCYAQCIQARRARGTWREHMHACA